MRKITLWFLLLGCFGSAFGVVRGAYYSHFAIEGDYVLMRRANSHNKHLAAAAGGPQGIPISAMPVECAKERGKALLETKDLIHDMWFDTGFSVALKLFPSIRSTWEARYLGGLAWQGQKSRYCPRNLILDGNLAEETVDYNFASNAKAIYTSKMYTYELNYWRHVTPRYTDYFSASWLVGFRYFSIDEKLKMYFTRPVNFVAQTSKYRTRTENTSFGLQFGGDIEYNPYSWLTWGLVVKAGGLFNQDKQKTLMLDQGNTVTLRDIDRSGSNFAYMGQVFPFIEIRPTKHFFFLVNYQVIYVGNIATADRNLIFHGDGNILNHGGHIIYHGATGAIQFNF